MENKPMMKCGHAANAVTADNQPACVICNCTELSEQEINLTGRKARCAYFPQCTSESKSSTSLPFFAHKPESDYDEYYCGCWGWD